MLQSIARPMVVGSENHLLESDRGVHDWYRFVLSFPAHLVRDYLSTWNLNTSHKLLDPFCGTGSTLVEAQKHGVQTIGLDGNPVAHFVAATKTNWLPSPNGLLRYAKQMAEIAENTRDDANELSAETYDLLLTDSISPKPLQKILRLKQVLLELKDTQYFDHAMLALIKTAVTNASNLRFRPEVGVTTKKKEDADVYTNWLRHIQTMTTDLGFIQNLQAPQSQVLLGDARKVSSYLEARSIDAVFTSPPYPNEKDYTRTTRLEAVLLGFLQNKQDLRNLKQNLLRSNTRNIYKNDTDEQHIWQFDSIMNLAEQIENRRIELEKTSGFERLYAKVTKHYFGGIAQHLASLRAVLRPGAHLGYVVGDQASFFRILIRTGQLTAEIAQSLGYELVGINLFRTRFSSITKENLREEIVVLRWHG